MYELCRGQGLVHHTGLYSISLVVRHPTGGLGKPTVLLFSFSSCSCASNARASLWGHFLIVLAKLSAGVKSQFGDLLVFCSAHLLSTLFGGNEGMGRKLDAVPPS